MFEAACLYRLHWKIEEWNSMTLLSIWCYSLSHELLNQEWLSHCTSRSVNACVRYRFSISSQWLWQLPQTKLKFSAQKCWVAYFFASVNWQNDFFHPQIFGNCCWSWAMQDSIHWKFWHKNIIWPDWEEFHNHLSIGMLITYFIQLVDNKLILGTKQCRLTDQYWPVNWAEMMVHP